MFFISVHRTIPRQNFLDYMKQVLTSETFEAFVHDSVFNKTVFYLGEKQDMLVNDECSSWYNKVGDFLCRFGIGGKKSCTAMDQ